MPGWIAGWAGRAFHVGSGDWKCVWNWKLLEEFSPWEPAGSRAHAGDQDGSCTEPEQPQSDTGVTWAGRSGNPSAVPSTLPDISIPKAQNILQFCLDDWHEEEDISKSEWAPQVTCWEGVIREIATPKLLLGSSELAVPLQRVVSLDCAFPGDFTMEGWHWWAEKGLNAGQLMSGTWWRWYFYQSLYLMRLFK